MKYIALLRGINVGGNHKVEMKKLKDFFESLGCTHVFTYINSGNVFFTVTEDQTHILGTVENKLKTEFGFAIPTLIKTATEMRSIVAAIPQDWHNDETHKTDVAYLFPGIDSPNILAAIPVNKACIDIRYVPGALFWNVEKKNYNKSQLNKLISNTVYKSMTIRNVNTARYLAQQ